MSEGTFSDVVAQLFCMYHLRINDFHVLVVCLLV